MIRVDILIFYTRNRTFASPVPYFFHKKNWLIGQFFYAGLLYLVRQLLAFSDHFLRGLCLAAGFSDPAFVTRTGNPLMVAPSMT